MADERTTSVNATLAKVLQWAGSAIQTLDGTDRGSEFFDTYKTTFTEADTGALSSGTTLVTVGGLTVGEVYEIIYTATLNSGASDDNARVLLALEHDGANLVRSMAEIYRDGSSVIDNTQGHSPIHLSKVFAATTATAEIVVDQVGGAFPRLLQRNVVVKHLPNASESADITIT